jgi:hypothetical protein
MKLWHNLSAPLKSWLFFHPLESTFDSNGQIVAANTAFTALWPVVQPLSVTLGMIAKSPKLPLAKRYIPGAVFTWHLREEEVPAHVAVTALFKAIDPTMHSEEARHELTPQVLADWLARAHAQQSPEEGYTLVLDRLGMCFTRARLLEDQAPSAKLALGPQTYAIPVEKREDGLWVSGPIPYTIINPPIKVTLYRSSGRLVLEICVGWSPWIEAGSAEAELLKACLHELEKQGWEAD